METSAFLVHELSLLDGDLEMDCFNTIEGAQHNIAQNQFRAGFAPHQNPPGLMVSEFARLLREESLQRSLAGFMAHTIHDDGSSTLGELRAEAEFWHLLSLISESDQQFDSCSNVESLKEWSISSNVHLLTIPELLTAAHKQNSVLSTLALVKHWLEEVAEIYVEKAPTSSAIPLRESFQKNMLSTIHPDALFTVPDRLTENDLEQQTGTLRVVFQLIRCGKISEAHALAFENNIPWLSAAMRGAEKHYYAGVDNDSCSVTRMGNVNQSMWFRSCWGFSTRLSENIETSSDFRNLHMTVFAALSSNMTVLNKSPVISSWHDKLWVVTSALYTSLCQQIIKNCMQVKISHSQYYPGCTEKLNTLQQDFCLQLQNDLACAGIGSITDILTTVTIPVSADFCHEIWILQGAVLRGPDGLRQFWNYMVKDLIASISGNHRSRVILRILSHFALWLRSSTTQSIFNGIVSDEIFHCVLEKYIDSLVDAQQFDLVAFFCQQLCRTRRIHKYAQMVIALLTFRANGTVGEKWINFNPFGADKVVLTTDYGDICDSVLNSLIQLEYFHEHTPLPSSFQEWWSAPVFPDRSRFDVVVVLVNWLKQDEAFIPLARKLVNSVSTILMTCPVRYVRVLELIDQFQQTDGFDYESTMCLSLLMDFWKELCVTCDGFSSWIQSIDNYKRYRSGSNDLLSRRQISEMVGNLVALTSKALACTRGILLFTSNSATICDGFRELFGIVEDSTLDSILESFRNELERSGKASQSNSILWKPHSSLSISDTTERIIHCLKEANIDDSRIIQISTAMDKAVLCLNQCVDLEQYCAVALTVERCQQHLDDLANLSKVKRQSLRYLIDSASQITLQTLKVLEVEDCLYLGKDIIWDALELVSIVGDDESSLQLYKLMTEDELEKFVQDMNEIAGFSIKIE